jgi:hypothetical protein
LTTSRPRQRLDGLANTATAARRCHLYGYSSTVSPLRPRVDSLTNTAIARRCHLYGYSSTACCARPRLDDLASTATARRPRQHGNGSTASPTRL